jgi:hypothetical protein
MVYEYTIDLWSTSMVLHPGHCLRVDIASANFPRFDRNPNTGHSLFRDAELQAATQTIFHDAVRPSHVVLPVIPRQSCPLRVGTSSATLPGGYASDEGERLSSRRSPGRGDSVSLELIVHDAGTDIQMRGSIFLHPMCALQRL